MLSSCGCFLERLVRTSSSELEIIYSPDVCDSHHWRGGDWFSVIMQETDRSMVSEESFQKNGCLVDWAEAAAYLLRGSKV